MKLKRILAIGLSGMLLCGTAWAASPVKRQDPLDALKQVLKQVQQTGTSSAASEQSSAQAEETPAEQPAEKTPVPELPAQKPKITLPVHKHVAACENTTAEPVNLICILDRSGSMQHLTSDTIGGYNSFIEQQKKLGGEAVVTTVLFDNRYEKLLDKVSLTEVPELTEKEYQARGTTAMLDAIGMTLNELAGEMEKEGICPSRRKVLCCIMTDGQENASQEYDKASVKYMITQGQQYGWEFVFLGANIDVAQEAEAIGISRDKAVAYQADAAGVQQSFSKINKAASSFRKQGSVSQDWKN